MIPGSLLSGFLLSLVVMSGLAVWWPSSRGMLTGMIKGLGCGEHMSGLRAEAVATFKLFNRKVVSAWKDWRVCLRNRLGSFRPNCSRRHCSWDTHSCQDKSNTKRRRYEHSQEVVGGPCLLNSSSCLCRKHSFILTLIYSKACLQEILISTFILLPSWSSSDFSVSNKQEDIWYNARRDRQEHEDQEDGHSISLIRVTHLQDPCHPRHKITVVVIIHQREVIKCIIITIITIKLDNRTTKSSLEVTSWTTNILINIILHFIKTVIEVLRVTVAVVVQG